MKRSSIYITEDFESIIEEILSKSEGLEVKQFIKDDFLIDDSKDVAKEAYITSERGKIIIICAKTFNPFSQNSLLKILEEPPSNTYFKIISPSKSALLPTIRSRLPLEKRRVVVQKERFPLELKKMDLKDIFDFLKKYQYLSKDETIKLIEAMFEAVVEAKIPLKQKELKAFDRACKLVYLNERSGNVLMHLLLCIFRRSKIEGKTFR
jgi:DNA polymerase-3 subunit delta'